MKAGDGVSSALLVALRAEGLDTVTGAFAYDKGERMVKPGLGHRTRIRFHLTDGDGCGHELYMKLYDREPPAEMLRRWRTYGVGTSPAGVEWANIEAVRQAGVSTMQPVVMGEGQQGQAHRSYIIVAAVPGRKLEEHMPNLIEAHRGEPELIASVTADLAGLVRKLHGAGYVHRDLYSSHIFLDETGSARRLYLIDLARVFAPRWRMGRWLIKDLTQLRYSLGMKAWAAGWWWDFMRAYLQTDDPRILRRWQRRMDLRATMTRIRLWGRGADLPQ